MSKYWDKIDRWEYKTEFYTVQQWQHKSFEKGMASSIMTNEGLSGWNAYSVVPAIEEDFLNPGTGPTNGYRVFYKRLVPDPELFIRTWSAPEEQ